MPSVKLIKATGIYTILGFIPLVSSFLLLPINTKYLSSADYGIVTLASVTESYLILFTIFGLHNAITVFYFDYVKEDSIDQANELLSNTLSFLVIVSCLIGFILLFFGDLILNMVWQGNLPFREFGWFIFVNSVFLSLNQVLFQYYRIREEVYKAALVTVLPFIFTTIGGIVGVVFLKLGALGNIGGKSLGFACVSIPFYLVIFKKYGFTINLRKMKQMYIYSYPIVLYTLLGTVSETIDKFIINRNFQLSQLGIYNLAFTVVSPIAILVMSYWNAVNPTMYKILTLESDSKLTKYFDGVLISTLIPIWGLIIIASPVITFFTNASYHGAIKLIPLLSLFALGRAYYLIYSFNIFYYKKTIYLPLINVGALVVGGGSAFILVHFFGLWGICISVILAKFSQAFFSYLVEMRLKFRMYPIHRQLLPVIITCLVIPLNYFYLYEKVDMELVNIVEGFLFFMVLAILNWGFILNAWSSMVHKDIR